LNHTHLDIFPYPDNIHSEFGSPIPLLGRKIWSRAFETPFLGCSRESLKRKESRGNKK